MLTKVRHVFRRLLPLVVAAPRDRAGSHVVSEADAEEQRPPRTVLVFVHLAGWMHHEGTRLDIDRPVRRPHHATALEAEIDFRRVRVAVVGTDLSRLPARDRHVAVRISSENFLHMLPGVEALLIHEVESVHWVGAPNSTLNLLSRAQGPGAPGGRPTSAAR